MDYCGSGYGLMADTCQRGNAPMGTIEDRDSLQMLSDYSLLQTDSAP
jgi:hypothetical protein